MSARGRGKRAGRPDYGFYRRPVTVYDPVWDAFGALHLRRTVLPRAFLAAGRSFSMGSAYAGSGLTGARSGESFTLVVPVERRAGAAGAGGGPEGIFALGSGCRFVPGAAFEALEDKAGFFTLARGTRVFDGIGPIVRGDEAWAAFIPARVDGVYEIGRASLRRGADGAPCHIEGGG